MKKFCRDKVMNVVTLKGKVSGLDRKTKSRQVMLTNELTWLQQKSSMLRHTSKLKKGFNVATGILRSRHKNKLNTDKQGHDRLFHVTTKILTQGREILL